MFLCRRLVLLRRNSFHTRFSFSSSSYSKLDPRPLSLQARVEFLINLPDLDTAAKHARLAPFSRDYVKEDLGNCAHYIDQTCNAIIGAMCEAKRYKEALELFNYFFHDSKIKPFRGYFNHIIKYYIDDHGRLEQALELYDSSFANSASESLITKGLVDVGMLDEAIDRLKPKDFSTLSSDVCNSLFKGLLHRGDLVKAYEVLSDIQGRDDKVVTTLSSILMNGRDKVVILSITLMEFWFEKGKEEEALKCYNDLKLLIGTTVNALLELLLKYGRKTEAWSVLEQVLDSKEMFNLDSDTLNIMVNECFEIGQFNEAIEIFNKVKALKLKYPEGKYYKNIITKFNERSLLLETEHFFEEMCLDRLVKPDVSIYMTMIDAYRKAGKDEDALRISNKMVDAFLAQVAWLACL